MAPPWCATGTRNGTRGRRRSSAALKARQGVRYPVLEGLMVADPDDARAGAARTAPTMGEVFMRGNIVMKGYLKNPKATEEAFAGGWFHTGDLGVMHPDGYIEIKDRSKDIIISGGENISTIEVEGVLYRHPAVLEAAVVARPDEQWGETPCAFVTLKPGAAATAAEIIAFCREHLAHFKAPRTVVFGAAAQDLDRKGPEIRPARPGQNPDLSGSRRHQIPKSGGSSRRLSPSATECREYLPRRESASPGVPEHSLTNSLKKSLNTNKFSHIVEAEGVERGGTINHIETTCSTSCRYYLRERHI